MAVTIVRTNWIDDDGTGTTGTVINNAVKTALYNDIDGALAKVAQLAGANTFTGNQTINGFQVVTGPSVTFTLSTGFVVNAPGIISVAIVSVLADLAAHQNIALQNSNAGNVGTFLYCLNSAAAPCGGINQNGATGLTFATTSDARLKTDEGRAQDLRALRAVVVHDFVWTPDGRRDRGVFAQEADQVFPRAVVVGTDETTDTGALARPWMTDYSKFVPDLIVGWQQHDAALEEIRALLATVKGEIYDGCQ
jgi:hypothetical protein